MQLEHLEDNAVDTTLRGLTTILRHRDAERSLRQSPRDFLEQAGVRGENLDHMTARTDRLLVYRQLVLNRFVDAVDIGIPQSIEVRGRAAFLQEVSLFLEDQASRSPYLRDIASEFVAWVSPRWLQDPNVPDYLPSLARHELLSFEMASEPEESNLATGDELDLELPVAFQRAARIVRYPFAVHRATSDQEPPREDVALLAYRDKEHRVRFLELGVIAAAVLTELMDDCAPLRQAISQACVATEVEVTDDILSGIAELLADLAERGVLLGSKSPLPAPSRE